MEVWSNLATFWWQFGPFFSAGECITMHSGFSLSWGLVTDMISCLYWFNAVFWPFWGYMHFKNELREFKRLWLWNTMSKREQLQREKERVVCIHWIPNAIRRVRYKLIYRQTTYSLSLTHIQTQIHTQWLTFANYLSVKTLRKHLLFRAIFISRVLEQVSY